MTPQDTPNSATDADRKAAEDWASRPEYSQKYKMWLRPSHVEAFLAGAAWERARLKPVLDALDLAVQWIVDMARPEDDINYMCSPTSEYMAQARAVYDRIRVLRAALDEKEGGESR